MVNKSNFYYSSFFIQDTIPQKPFNDTVEVKSINIDPLFLELERKAKEVEAYKKKVSLEAARSKIRQIKPPVDTTCHWCPGGELKPLHKLVVASEINTPKFYPINLYDKNYYTENFKIKAPVYIENDAFTEVKAPTKIYIKPRFQESNHFEWVFIPIFALVLALAFIRFFYRKFLSEYFQSTVFFFAANKQKKESNFLSGWISLSLDLIYFLSTSVFAVLFVNQKFDFEEIAFTPFEFTLYFFLGLIAFRLFRYFCIKLLGILSDQKAEFDELFYHQLIFPRVFGIIAIPLIAILAYGKDIAQLICIYTFVFSFGLMTVFRIFRSLKVFLINGFSVFYFLLYLCALEILPVLFILHEFIGK